MSGSSKSAIDVMTAEDTALLDSMRNETDAPEVNDAPVEASEDADLDAPEAVETPDPGEPDIGNEPKKTRYTKRVFELTEQAKAAEARAAAAEQARAVSEGVVAERLRLLTEAANAALQPAPVAPPAPPPIEVPDINTDPVGHFKAQYEIQARTITEQNAILQGMQEQQQRAQQVAELRNWGSAQEAAFSAKEPAYNEAMGFMIDRRKAQLAAIGISDPAQQQQVIANDITQIAMKSRAEGANFGERMWKVAEAFGFTKKAPEAVPAAATTPAVPAIPPLEAGLPAADRVAQAERGRANSTTIAAVGSSTPVAITPDRIANMSEADFAKYLDNVRAKGGSALRDLLGH